MVEVPPGGYPESRDFDVLYTELLGALHAVWQSGDSGKLGDAVYQMFGLTGPAITLIQTPLKSGKGNYGPSFQYIPAP